jgi:fatty-acyl-CoA synthase
VRTAAGRGGTAPSGSGNAPADTQVEPAVKTVVARLEASAGAPGGLTFVGSTAAGGLDPVSWGQLHDEAQAVAAALQARGIGPNDHVALLGPTSRRLVTTIQATWLAGATLVCLPLPMRLGSIEEFAAQTRRRIGHAEAKIVVVDPELAPFLTHEPGDPPVVGLDELRGRARDWERPPDDPDALALVQFTSGSTADPKGVMLPHRCIVENIDAIVEGAGLGPDDRGVSWLPLYHDMGLIGLLMTPMLTGFDLVLAAPTDFLAAPADWLRWMSDFQGTVTCAPNFGYALAARAMRRVDDIDLSSWRLGLNGAEPIDPTSVEAFLEAGARHGLDPNTAFCVYGMAEATLAISFPTPGAGMTVDTVDPDILERFAYAAPVDNGEGRRLARLGRPLRGLEVRVCDPDTGRLREEREVGELELRGASVTPGYFQRDDVTAATFHDGWLRTGDLGYLVDGEVVACGRIKDVIIIGGRNVFPEEIERAVASVGGVRPGNVIAFGTEGRRGKEGIVVVAETKTDDLAAIHDQVVDRVCAAVGVPPREVVLVQAGSLPKTSSGKLQRSRCRDQYLDDALAAS